MSGRCARSRAAAGSGAEEDYWAEAAAGRGGIGAGGRRQGVELGDDIVGDINELAGIIEDDGDAAGGRGGGFVDDEVEALRAGVGGDHGGR